MISIVDVVIVVILSGFVYYGLFFGLIRTAGSIISLFAGVWAASHFYGIVYSWISGWLLGYELFGKIIAYILLFTLVNRGLMIAFAILDKTYNLLTIIPFLKTINRLGGALFGLIEGSIVIAVGFYFLAAYASLPIVGGWVVSLLANSKLVLIFLKLAGVLSPFLPQAIVTIKRLV